MSAPNPDILKDLSETRAALNNLLINDAEYSLKFARQKIYESGDKPGKYLASLVKKRSASQTILSSGSRYLDTKSIKSEFALFYANLYTSEQPDNAFDLMHSFFLKPDNSTDLRCPKTPFKCPHHQRGCSLSFKVYALREGARAGWVWV